ncbi:ROK family protein [Yoonia sp. 208BN28-4]|uniref:ROK family protein n=1 Tax=Yoonia sp. 208BN28-4 TaxID=3126505 RepID=UPI0030AC8A2B
MTTRAADTTHAIAAGIDIGGTKIEVQVFDSAWTTIARQRVATPTNYPALLTAVTDVIGWARDQSASPLPVGIGAAGLVNPATGLALAANLPASGHPFPADIAEHAGQPVTYINDCRALAVSEAVFGAGQPYRTVASIIMGTGIGGGICIEGHILTGPTATGGELGHTAAPAHVVAAHNLPIVQCGCGRMGCIETLVAGPGLQRIAKHLTGADLSPQEIAARRHDDMAQVWDVWCALAAELVLGLTLTVDPDVIVLAGGLSRITGIADDLAKAAAAAQFGGFGIPPIVLAQGGDASGARGAAYVAWQDQHGANA